MISVNVKIRYQVVLDYPQNMYLLIFLFRSYYRAKFVDRDLAKLWQYHYIK